MPDSTRGGDGADTATPSASATSAHATGTADARTADARTADARTADPTGVPGAPASTPSPTLDFTAATVSPHVTRIRDPHDVLMYLVAGTERALLVDTGYGVGDLAGFVAGLTDLPVTVALTHAHVDHAFGASQFDDVRLNPAELPVLAEHQVLSTRMHEQVDAAARDATDATPKPYLAPAVDPSTLTALVAGDRIDLGGVTVAAFATPGHTPGSLALLVETDRLLITGDAANQLTFLFLPESSSVAAYAGTLRRLREETAGLYDRVLVSHGTGEITPTVIDDLLALCARVLAGTDDAVPLEFQGRQGLVARAVAPAAGTPHPGAPEGPAVDDLPNLVYSPDRIH